LKSNSISIVGFTSSPLLLLLSGSVSGAFEISALTFSKKFSNGIHYTSIISWYDFSLIDPSSFNAICSSNVWTHISNYFLIFSVVLSLNLSNYSAAIGPLLQLHVYPSIGFPFGPFWIDLLEL